MTYAITNNKGEVMKVTINPYVNPPKSLQQLLKHKVMYSLSFQYVAVREKFRGIDNKSFFLQNNGLRLFISVNRGFSLNDVIKEIENQGFTVNTDMLEAG